MEAFVTIWRDDRSSQFEFTPSEASLPCFKPWLCPLLGSSHTGLLSEFNYCAQSTQDNS